ncbi:MAG: murein hydrolase activator EnvC family protein [Dehalobacterium sp.]
MLWLRGRRIVAGIVVTGFILTTGLLPAYGDQLTSFKKKQQNLKQQISEQKETLKEKESQRKTYVGQLNQLEDEMDLIQSELNTLTEQLKDAEKKVAQSTEELRKSEEELAERMDLFSQLVKEVYLNGQVSYLEVAFDATSFSDLLTRFDLMEKLVEQDVEILNRVEAQIKEVEAKKAQLEKERNEIVRIQRSTKRKEQDLASRQQEKRQWIARIEEDKKQIEKALNEMERNSNQLAAQINKIQQERMAKSGSKFNGVFSWPTPGYTRITSDYGYRIHPVLKTKRMHTGIDIGAPSGTSIKAVAKGTVIYAGWLGAYGNAVVIDHGGGISSMYAHQSRISVSVDEDVKKGDTVGKVGSTGWSTGPHLHFEVRKNGNPINPWNYLK